MIGTNSNQAPLPVSAPAVADVTAGTRTRHDSAFLLELHTLACGKAYIAVLKHVRGDGSTDDLKAVFEDEYRKTMIKAGVEPIPDA
jgi:hypothetical protein